MLQSLTERVERLEAKAELFDKGLEVCVDAHKEKWIDSKDARKLLGWQTISTTKFKAAGIRYQQPLGKHHKITAHKGDIENYVRNRRNGRK